MKRLLANAIVMASGIAFSSQLMALGLGELTLDSALNQPLQASIELTDTKGLTEWDIKPSLASQADFDRAGVDRDFFLTSIKFNVENNKIVLTTKDAVNEPFLNFLLELNWPSGRVLREYTVLLDPPTFAETNFQPLVSGATSTTEEITLAAPDQPVQVNHWDEAAAPGSYKVQPNDTLWAVALETRPSADITPQQMMLALQQENPNAFIGGNINRLKSHTVLNIPTEEQIRNIRQEQAIAEVARQNNSLQTGVAQIDATGLNQSATTSTSSSSGGEVRLVSASSSAAEEAGSSGDASSEMGEQQRQSLENDLAIALENADKSSRENKELRDRLESLQEQIDTLQSLLTLKDDELANIQAGQGVDDAVAVEEVAVAEESATGAEAIDFNYQDGVAENTEAETVETAEATDEQAAEQAAAAQAEEERKAEERRQRIAALMAEQEIHEPELLDQVFELLENPAVLGGGAAGLLLILLLLARVLKARKEKSTDEIVEFNDPAVLDGFDEDNDALADFDFEADGEDTAGVSLEGDSADELFEEAEADVSSDVLVDVERSLAYGQQAEALLLLENAIAAEPERIDYRIKQLEIFTEKDDEEAFHEAENALNAIVGSEDVAEEVAALRERLTAPIDPVDDFASFEQELAAEFSDGLDFASALDQSEAMFAEDEAAAVPTLDMDDFGADLDIEIPVVADEVVELEEPAAEEEEEDDGIEFDLEGFSLETNTAASSEESISMADSDDALEFEGFDFEETAAPATEEEPTLDMESFELNDEFDLGDLEDDVTDINVDVADIEGAVESLETLEVDEPSAEVADDLENEVEALEFDLSADLEQETDSIESLESILDGADAGSDEMPDFDFNLDTGELSSDDSSDTESLEEEISFDLDDISLDSDLLDIEEESTEEASTEEVLQETAEFDASEIDLDSLADADDEFEFLSGTDECATKLDLARAYIDMDDAEGAKELLQEVVQEGNETQQAEARELIRNL